MEQRKSIQFMRLSCMAAIYCGCFACQEESTFTIRFHALCTKRTIASGSVMWMSMIRSHHENKCIMPSSSKVSFYIPVIFFQFFLGVVPHWATKSTGHVPWPPLKPPLDLRQGLEMWPTRKVIVTPCFKFS